MYAYFALYPCIVAMRFDEFVVFERGKLLAAVMQEIMLRQRKSLNMIKSWRLCGLCQAVKFTNWNISLIENLDSNIRYDVTVICFLGVTQVIFRYETEDL